jgi:hypothetical protein
MDEKRVLEEYQKRVVELLHPSMRHMLSLPLTPDACMFLLRPDQWTTHLRAKRDLTGYMESWEEMHGNCLAVTQFQREYGLRPGVFVELPDEELGDNATLSCFGHYMDMAVQPSLTGDGVQPYGTGRAPRSLTAGEAMMLKPEGTFCCVCLSHLMNPAQTGTLFSCSKCKRIKYCSSECQKTNWKLHKVMCGIRLPNLAKMQREADFVIRDIRMGKFS